MPKLWLQSGVSDARRYCRTVSQMYVRCSCFCVHPAVLILGLHHVRASQGEPFVCLDKEGGESRGTVRVLTSWLRDPALWLWLTDSISSSPYQLPAPWPLIWDLPPSTAARRTRRKGGRRRVNARSYAHIWTGGVISRRPCCVLAFCFLFCGFFSPPHASRAIN